MIALAVFAAAGLAAIAVGSFLDWVSLSIPGLDQLLELFGGGTQPGFSVQGIDLWQGKLLVAVGGIGAIVAIIAIAAPGARRAAGILAIAGGAAALALAGTDVAEVLRAPGIPLPSFPSGGFPTDLPTNLPTELPSDVLPTSPAAYHEPVGPAAFGDLQQIPTGTAGLEVGIGLWLVLLGGLVALGTGIPLVLGRPRAPASPATAQPGATPPTEPA
jgi:hypothetical protein